MPPFGREPVRADFGEADRELRRMLLLLSDLRPFWPRVSRLFIGWMREQFEQEGAFWDDRWLPLSPAYAKRKRILWGDRPILQASGQARRAASKPTRRVTPRTLTLIIDDAGPQHGPVLQYHQEGDGVPRRPVIGDELPLVARRQLEDAAEAYVQDFLGRF